MSKSSYLLSHLPNPSLGVYVVCVGTCLCMHMCVWRPEVSKHQVSSSVTLHLICGHTHTHTSYIPLFCFKLKYTGTFVNQFQSCPFSVTVYVSPVVMFQLWKQLRWFLEFQVLPLQIWGLIVSRICPKSHCKSVLLWAPVLRNVF